MDNFIDVDKFKDSLIKEEDRIIEEKSFLFDQIKKLEFEENLLKNNLKFFQMYLINLESGKSDININDLNLKPRSSNDKYTTNDEDTDEFRLSKKQKHSEDNYMDEIIRKEFS